MVKKSIPWFVYEIDIKVYARYGLKLKSKLNMYMVANGPQRRVVANCKRNVDINKLIGRIFFVALTLTHGVPYILIIFAQVSTINLMHPF